MKSSSAPAGTSKRLIRVTGCGLSFIGSCSFNAHGRMAMRTVGQVCLLGVDLGSARDEELADLGTVVHVNRLLVRAVRVGCAVSTPFSRDFLTVRDDDLLEPSPRPDRT